MRFARTRDRAILAFALVEVREARDIAIPIGVEENALSMQLASGAVSPNDSSGRVGRVPVAPTDVPSEIATPEPVPTDPGTKACGVVPARVPGQAGPPIIDVTVTIAEPTVPLMRARRLAGPRLRDEIRERAGGISVVAPAPGVIALAPRANCHARQRLDDGFAPQPGSVPHRTMSR